MWISVLKQKRDLLRCKYLPTSIFSHLFFLRIFKLGIRIKKILKLSLLIKFIHSFSAFKEIELNHFKKIEIENEMEIKPVV